MHVPRPRIRGDNLGGGGGGGGTFCPETPQNTGTLSTSLWQKSGRFYWKHKQIESQLSQWWCWINSINLPPTLWLQQQLPFSFHWTVQRCSLLPHGSSCDIITVTYMPPLYTVMMVAVTIVSSTSTGSISERFSLQEHRWRKQGGRDVCPPSPILLFWGTSPYTNRYVATVHRRLASCCSGYSRHMHVITALPFHSRLGHSEPIHSPSFLLPHPPPPPPLAALLPRLTVPPLTDCFRHLHVWRVYQVSEAAEWLHTL